MLEIWWILSPSTRMTQHAIHSVNSKSKIPLKWQHAWSVPIYPWANCRPIFLPNTRWMFPKDYLVMGYHNFPQYSCLLWNYLVPHHQFILNSALPFTRTKLLDHIGKGPPNYRPFPMLWMFIDSLAPISFWNDHDQVDVLIVDGIRHWSYEILINKKLSIVSILHVEDNLMRHIHGCYQ